MDTLGEALKAFFAPIAYMCAREPKEREVPDSVKSALRFEKDAIRAEHEAKAKAKADREASRRKMLDEVADLERRSASDQAEAEAVAVAKAIARAAMENALNVHHQIAVDTLTATKAAALDASNAADNDKKPAWLVAVAPQLAVRHTICEVVLRQQPSIESAPMAPATHFGTAALVHEPPAEASPPATTTTPVGLTADGMDNESPSDAPTLSAEQLKALEAEELRKKQEAAAKKAKDQEELDAKNAARDAEIAAKGKRAAGGMHKFDPDEVDVHGGNATAEDFLDAFDLGGGEDTEGEVVLDTVAKVAAEPPQVDHEASSPEPASEGPAGEGAESMKPDAELLAREKKPKKKNKKKGGR